MKLTLTFEEGLKVVEAMRNAAIDNGWEPEEFDECGAIEEYGHMLDVAMKAMGFELRIESEPSEPRRTVKDDFIERYVKEGNSYEQAVEIADLLFDDEEDE